MRYQVGDRVVTLEDADDSGETFMGAIVGVDVDPEGYWYYVRFDNGEVGSYAEHELVRES